MAAEIKGLLSRYQYRQGGAAAVLAESDIWKEVPKYFVSRWYSLQTHIMYCQMCANLLAVYRHSINLYSTALRKSAGTQGDNSEGSAQEVERLSLKCRETHDALMAHWREEHRNMGQKRR
jgi:hypothetical protein